jgi:hypothetical protein
MISLLVLADLEGFLTHYSERISQEMASMEHIGRKEIYFVILIFFLLGVPVSADNGNYQEEESEVAYQLQMMKTLMKCLVLNDELMANHRAIENNTNKALIVFRNNLKADVFEKVRDRAEAYLDHSEELLNINREIIGQIQDYKTPNELRDAIYVIAFNQTVILLTFNNLCVLTDVAAEQVREENQVSRKAGNSRLYFAFHK